ncbi:unnamed protein product [Urochloa humidicola]
MAVVGWSDLPSELLTDVAAGIAELADIARFRSVCSSWRSASGAAAAAPPPQPPWLLLPSGLFFSPREDRIYPNLLLPRPAADRRRRLYASPHVWTLAVDPTDLAASLVHPFTGATRPLPTLPAMFKETDDLAWDWSPHGVMVSCGEGVLFCFASASDSAPPFAASWAPIPALADCSTTTINYAADQFFVFEEDVCRTTIVDALTLDVAAVLPVPAVDLPAEGHLAVAGENLFLFVKSKWMCLFGEAAVFTKALRLNHRSANPDWQDLTGGIGDQALFVDSLHGFAVPTVGFANLESNTIYSVSTTEVSNRRYATVAYSISAFSLDTGSSKKLASRLNDREMPMRGEMPSWIIPSLNQG